MTLDIHQHKTGCIPEFIAEVPIPLDATHIKLDITPCGSERGKGKAKRVASISLNAFWKFLAGPRINFLCHLGLHQAARPLGDQRIKRDTIDDIERVQHIALGFGHLLAICIPDKTMNVDRFEGHLRCAVGMLHEMHGHHDHPGDPEKNDVETRYEHIGRVEQLQFRRLCRPSQRRKSPQRG